ncbi:MULTISPECIES: hypothetical protein [Bacteroidaceae]|uniref:F0F1 ATP synthase subunit epsilon n=1 Tax=Bacteroidaceae TaxID=815 RepID=UPI000B3ABCDA|nr:MULTISPECIES: hypothetical protein [Bacteroidaceae]MDM8306235.1 hypothetical protein [Phocaeicola salanitronis]OUO23936.1 hypothetical protein B5F91_01650 [Bacteroides sp. An322]
MKELHLVIASPEQTVFEGKVDMAVLPGELGEFQVLVNHAPLISSLTAGEVRYTAGKESHSLSIKGGFVEVRDNQISVCAEL